MNLSICKTTFQNRQGRAEMWKCQSPYLYYKGKGRGVSHGCLAVFVIMLMGSISLTLTSCGADKQRYHFSTAQEGINCYREFYKEMRNASDDKMTAIVKDIATWQELEDSVMVVILRDTAAARNPHLFSNETVHNLHASVRDEFLNRAIARPRNLQDVLILKTEANRLTRELKIKDAMKTVTPFFLSLDSVSIYHEDSRQLTGRYQRYLYAIEKRGIRNKEQFLSFLREEDRLYRSFVTHISEMDGKSVTDITKSTEHIYARVSREKAGGTISSNELFLFLTMRTNRRLLACAQGCLMDIKASKVKTADQRQAYLWMVIQPFSVINDFGMAVLTEDQRAAFVQIAKDASSMLLRLSSSSKQEREHVEALPGLMVKIYISSL